MKHIMLDCYGSNPHQLDDIKHINDLLNKLIYELGVNPIAPPQLIPYYYGKVKEDLGISAFVFLEGGHVTIHTFSIRECYFVDLFYDGDFDENKVKDFFLTELPFNEQKSIINIKDRKTRDFKVLDYNPQSDFGPHLLSEIVSKKIPTMEEFFDFLEGIVVEINMDPITRPFVIKSTPTNTKYLSGLIVIAQSHIALHYCYETNSIYADIFSCAPFDFSTVSTIFSRLGEVVSNELIARGSKHIYKAKSNISNNDLLASTKWQSVIKH